MRFPVKTTKDGKTFLNVGCGALFFPEWNNIDLFDDPDVLNYDVRRGLPYPDASFDAVYSSHTLEHFSYDEGRAFLAEMHRVLRPGGVIRIAVPDLEQITREYIARLDDAKAHDTETNRKRLQWITFELFDQMIRSVSGGRMLEALKSGDVEIDYVQKRAGDQFQAFYTNKEAEQKTGVIESIKNILRPLKAKLLHENDPARHGELHKWMYDSYSLGKMLAHAGFSLVKVEAFDTSRIPGWKERNLDASAHHSGARKPDSLFMEASK